MNEHLPIHVHVSKGEAKGRIILEPTIDFHRNHGFKPSEVKKIVEIVVANYDYIIDKWHETFD